MSTTITHQKTDIVILASYETPAVQCVAGDLFIREGADGFWVSSWDGQEAWGCCGDEPAESLDIAIAWAREVIENTTTADEE